MAGLGGVAVWYHLRRLEERGLVYRPEGPKSGWTVAGEAEEKRGFDWQEV
jgi:repressor of nif and glnA expression